VDDLSQARRGGLLFLLAAAGRKRLASSPRQTESFNAAGTPQTVHNTTQPSAATCDTPPKPTTPTCTWPASPARRSKCPDCSSKQPSPHLLPAVLLVAAKFSDLLNKTFQEFSRPFQ
jgi:hypothetical protein